MARRGADNRSLQYTKTSAVHHGFYPKDVGRERKGRGATSRLHLEALLTSDYGSFSSLADLHQQESNRDYSTSAGNIPFKWEERPGISKCNTQIERQTGVKSLSSLLTKPSSDDQRGLPISPRRRSEFHHAKPLRPPPRLQQVKHGSTTDPEKQQSSRHFKEQPKASLIPSLLRKTQQKLLPTKKDEDPFLLAVKVCRKQRPDVSTHHVASSGCEKENDQMRLLKYFVKWSVALSKQTTKKSTNIFHGNTIPWK